MTVYIVIAVLVLAGLLAGAYFFLRKDIDEAVAKLAAKAIKKVEALIGKVIDLTVSKADEVEEDTRKKLLEKLNLAKTAINAKFDEAIKVIESIDVVSRE